jgi:hypothetical protein
MFVMDFLNGHILISVQDILFIKFEFIPIIIMDYNFLK